MKGFSRAALTMVAALGLSACGSDSAPSSIPICKQYMRLLMRRLQMCG